MYNHLIIIKHLVPRITINLEVHKSLIFLNDDTNKLKIQRIKFVMSLIILRIVFVEIINNITTK